MLSKFETSVLHTGQVIFFSFLTVWELVVNIWKIFSCFLGRFFADWQPPDDVLLRGLPGVSLSFLMSVESFALSFCLEEGVKNFVIVGGFVKTRCWYLVSTGVNASMLMFWLNTYMTWCCIVGKIKSNNIKISLKISSFKYIFTVLYDLRFFHKLEENDV